ncbi:MAG TPA: DUF4062 domain-containing protein [Pyrinomonadaceae bacterium]|nr:DUF4062 domain-containing protein [Pyrinomonadaceae bacterium]
MPTPPIKTAMISSTAVDLPEHRKQVVEACLRAGVFPIGMEHLPARDASGVHVSLEMVDRADIYIGVYAWRYGWVPDVTGVPNPDRISITEMEFNRALERKQSGQLKDILIFVMHDDHPIRARDKEDGAEAQEKLRKFKERAAAGRVRLTFTSPEELRGHVLHSLSESLRHIAEAEAKPGEPAKLELHRTNIIPTAPEPYIAHPYSLLQTAQVVGRQRELNLLTDWVTTNKQVPASVRLFNVVAIGGMGKSALTWKWFNDIAPHELPNRAGWMWWSFYESDAHYENFIIRALAYTSGQSEAQVRQLTQPEREDQLWRLLDEQPFVIVLDGLERILLAYSRMDASRMLDDDLDERTANRVARAIGLPESAGQSFIGKHQLRLTADQRAGQFLRRLARVRASRVLISTRLYPAELQAATGDPLPGCFAVFLPGLTDDDALSLWREFKVSGSREQLLPLFRSFGNYPLLIRALAGEVAGYRPAPRDFDQWRAANPGFNPAAELDLNNAKTHVLEYALRGLGEKQRKVLHTLAAFRMPATWDTLRALLVQSSTRIELAFETHSGNEDDVALEHSPTEEKRKPCVDDRELDVVLEELEDRGLMGWDKQANRYDLHPIVRGVVWAALAPEAKTDLYHELHIYFGAAPRPPDWHQVESLEDLALAVELFDKLIGLENYKEALVIFSDYLDFATLYRLSASRLQVELLERFFPNGVNAPPWLDVEANQGYLLNALALAYHFSGEPGRAASLYRRAAEICEREKNAIDVAVNLYSLSYALLPSGPLRQAEHASRRALVITRNEKNSVHEGASLYFLGAVLAACGQMSKSHVTLTRALSIRVAYGSEHGEGIVSAYLSLRYLWLGQFNQAITFAGRAWRLAHINRQEASLIHAARLHGEAALGLGDLTTAEERLNHALTRARAVNLVEQELPTLIALAELRRELQQYGSARELLEQVWAAAERGPYPLFHADANNVIARIERDEGHREAAMAAAARAYELAWCDGPPYAYHFGLTNAKQLLVELGAQDVITKLEAELPPFDESKFEPMPDVELNPKDEFWVDPATLESSS